MGSITGWFWPTGARKAHFDGGDGIALCKRWGSDDCTTCRRKLEEGEFG